MLPTGDKEETREKSKSGGRKIQTNEIEKRREKKRSKKTEGGWREEHRKEGGICRGDIAEEKETTSGGEGFTRSTPCKKETMLR